MQPQSDTPVARSPKLLDVHAHALPTTNQLMDCFFCRKTDLHEAYLLTYPAKPALVNYCCVPCARELLPLLLTKASPIVAVTTEKK